MSSMKDINYIKANKIRAKLLLFIDNEIKANKKNKINIDQEDLFEIKFEESFTHREMNGTYFTFDPNPKKISIYKHIIISSQKKTQVNSHYDSISTVDTIRHKNSTCEIGNSKTFIKIAQKPPKKILNLNKTRRISWKKKLIYQSCIFNNFVNSDYDFKLKSTKKIKKIKKDKNYLRNLCNNFKKIRKGRKAMASCRNSTKNLDGNINFIENINQKKNININKNFIENKSTIEKNNESNNGKNNFINKKATKTDNIKQMIRSRNRASTLRYLTNSVKQDSGMFNSKLNLGINRVYSPRKKRIVSFKDN